MYCASPSSVPTSHLLMLPPVLPPSPTVLPKLSHGAVAEAGVGSAAKAALFIANVERPIPAVASFAIFASFIFAKVIK